LPGLTPVILTEAATVLMPFLLVAFLTSLLADDIEASKRALRTMSDRDPLTRLLNIGAFMRVAERMHSKIEQQGDAYSIIVVDIDQLKHINDTYGHAAGNKAIDTVGRALLRVTRSGDIAARIGGEEFVAFLPKCEIPEATDLAQRLKNLVYSATFEVNVDIVRVQVSVGVANFPVDGETLQRVMSAADRAMYQDKQLRARPEGQLVIQKR
jgi:diguanylate cyclase (GGDEF)-like protein